MIGFSRESGRDERVRSLTALHLRTMAARGRRGAHYVVRYDCDSANVKPLYHTVAGLIADASFTSGGDARSDGNKIRISARQAPIFDPRSSTLSVKGTKVALRDG